WQLDAYQQLVDNHPEKFQMIHTKQDLNHIIDIWDQLLRAEEVENMDKYAPVGLVILMEGAEGVRSVDELENWWERGVRIIGPAWAGTRFCGGTNEPGPLTRDGYELLTVMSDIGFALDISHMDEEAALQALDFYPSTIIASHANAKALLPKTSSNRFLSDRVIAGLIERGGMAGVVPYNGHLCHDWKDGDDRNRVPLHYVIDQIDYYCQIAGNADHVGIGTDFDGGFGLQSTPDGIDTIADLQKLAPMLANKGYAKDEIKSVFGSNWLRYLDDILPENS
ncbi:MAG: membrane dipeptidase, partial [Anaerolineaceae bacterium]|nr:membrane dipeptidase [Anaerolineaceae bacterium]